MPYADPQKQREAQARNERKPETIAYRKEWAKKNPEKRRESTRRWRMQHPQKWAEIERNWKRKNPFSNAVKELAKGAKKSGTPIDREYCRSLTVPTVCPVLGTPIRFAVGEGFRPMHETASFDRVDNNLGYIRGNVCIVSRLANTMKSCATPAQLLAFSAWIQKTYDQRDV